VAVTKNPLNNEFAMLIKGKFSPVNIPKQMFGELIDYWFHETQGPKGFSGN
jgi:hypothetical protein